MAFEVTLYGLAASVALLSAYSFVVARSASGSWSFALFAGSVIASLLPSHVVIAAVGLVAVTAFLLIGVAERRSLRPPLAFVPPSRWPIILSAGGGLAGSIIWGFFTGHGLGGTAVSPSIQPFNSSWQESALAIAIGAGAYCLMLPAIVISRRDHRAHASAFPAVIVTVIGAFVLWGLRLGDFNMFHVAFGAIAVFATPAAAIAMWTVWSRVRHSGRPLLRMAVASLFVIQLEVGAVQTVQRMQQFGPAYYPPVPLAILDEIRDLPSDAKLAYACGTTQGVEYWEISYWDPRLLAIGVHASHGIIPMCFEADAFAHLVGGPIDPKAESPLFLTAPQRAIYPSASSRPTPADVNWFLQSHGIGYIYADDSHPNTLVPDAVLIAQAGQFMLFRVP
jgi:hypothetical protein